MSDINLLPEELKPSGYVSSIDFTIRKLSMILFGLLLLLCIGGGGVYGFLYYQNNKLTKSINQIESDIKALEGTEQRLALIKDRLSKTEMVLLSDNVNKSEQKLSSILENIDPKAQITSSELRSSQILVDILFPDTDASEKFVEYLKVSNDYNQIDMKEYSFKEDGYNLALILALR